MIKTSEYNKTNKYNKTKELPDFWSLHIRHLEEFLASSKFSTVTTIIAITLNHYYYYYYDYCYYLSIVHSTCLPPGLET